MNQKSEDGGKDGAKIKYSGQTWYATVKNTFCDQTDDGKVFVCIKLKDLSVSFQSNDI